MIIDCHGHYTTAPPAVGEWRRQQIAALEAGDRPAAPPLPEIGDDEIRVTVEKAQLRIQRERGIDLTLFSPRASWMGHHVGNADTSATWTRLQNELVKRVCDLFPAHFAPVCQLPQSPGESIEGSVAELERCVLEMGFVGCNVNPDPSGGMWTGRPLSDRYWAPLWEKMCELDVPAMIHVSTCVNDNFHTTSSHYLGADTTAFMQALTSGFMRDFPGLRWIIPHGGGAVPYHWGRLVGMAADQGWDIDEVLDHVFFDTCVYHQPGIELLLRVVPHENILFASEMIGAVRGIDPGTGRHYDDTKFYLDNAELDATSRDRIFAGNALRVFPRLAGRDS